MSYQLDILKDGKYFNVASTDKPETAKLMAGRMPGLDGWRVYLDTRESFKPITGSPVKPRVSSQEAFKLQVEWTVRDAWKRREATDSKFLVPILVFPSPIRRGWSHRFRLEVACALLNIPKNTWYPDGRITIESLLPSHGFRFVEVDPDEWKTQGELKNGRR